MQYSLVKWLTFSSVEKQRLKLPADKIKVSSVEKQRKKLLADKIEVLSVEKQRMKFPADDFGARIWAPSVDMTRQGIISDSFAKKIEFPVG